MKQGGQARVYSKALVEENQKKCRRHGCWKESGQPKNSRIRQEQPPKMRPFKGKPVGKPVVGAVETTIALTYLGGQ
jgi:hypothetical protein